VHSLGKNDSSKHPAEHLISTIVKFRKPPKGKMQQEIKTPGSFNQDTLQII
jgi:hypothetical protein